MKLVDGHSFQAGKQPLQTQSSKLELSNNVSYTLFSKYAAQIAVQTKTKINKKHSTSLRHLMILIPKGKQSFELVLRIRMTRWLWQNLFSSEVEAEEVE
jgi:hypothetical protein